MSTCRWVADASDYLRDGEPCRTDDYGDPTKHCKARRTCSVHIGADELTCPRCIGRTRADLRRIPVLAAFALPVAVASGVNSEAANLAGPGADYRVFSARRAIDRAWIVHNIPESQLERAMSNLLEDDDERHPYSVLTRWASMIAEDYGHDLPTLTVTRAADYLDRNLARIANDAEQDWALLATEVRRCRRGLEEAVALAVRPERGAPCPDCTSEETGVGPRLVRQYAHWCDDEGCERLHYDDDSEDRWVCPRDRGHAWTEKAYRDYIEERRTA